MITTYPTTDGSRDVSKGLTLEVASKESIADGVVELILQRPDKTRLPDWTPGAHIDVALENGVTRQYSLCGDPFDAYTYRIAVLREADGRGGSAFIHEQLEVGSSVGLGGPRNNFALTPSPRYLFVAGGIGITPLLPMMRAADQLGSEWSLLYLGRASERMGYRTELSALGDHVRLHASGTGGRADLPAIVKQCDDFTKLYACGPPSLIDDIQGLTSSWRPGRVYTERFSAKTQEAPARSTPFEVEFADSGIVLTVPPGVSVASVARQAGSAILTSCNIGVCGTCESRLLGGMPDHRDSLLTDEEREAGTYFYPCVSRAKSDRIVLAL